MSRRAAAAMLLLVCACLAGPGCSDVTVRGYTPVKLPLDGLSELHLSTYPAGLARRVRQVPFVYEALETPDAVWFQIHVREAGTPGGANPHVDSIHIRSFSYRWPGQEPVILISDHRESFWQQEPGAEGLADGTPVPWAKGWHLRAHIEFTLNGREYEFDERLDATTRSYRVPLITRALR